MSKCEKQIKKHQQHECDGNEHDYENWKPIDLRAEHTKAAQNATLIDDHWKCNSCNKTYPKNQINRINAHITAKHKRPRDQFDDDEIDKMNKKAKRDIDNHKAKTKTNVAKLINAANIDATDVPECLIPELYMKRITILTHNNEKHYKCSECNFSTAFTKPDSITRHINAKHNIILDTEDRQRDYECPFCQKAFCTYSRLKNHLFYMFCNPLNDFINNNTGDELWILIKNQNNKNMDIDL